MDPKDFVTIGISVIALLVALYGIRERRSAALVANRLEVANVVSELNQLSLDEAQVPAEDRDSYISSGAASHGNARRETLCATAASLLTDKKLWVTERELAALAEALRRVGDWKGAGETWKRALDVARNGSVYQCFVLRGYAAFQFKVSMPDEGRRLFRRALNLPLDSKDLGRIMKAETLVFWADSEADWGNSVDEVKSLLAQAKTAAESIDHQGTRERLEHFLSIRATGIQARFAEPI